VKVQMKNLALLWGRALGVVILAAVLGPGCGGQKSSEVVFRVGLLTPGSIRDSGWNQSAYEGLLRIRDELGAEVAHQVTRTPQEFEESFRDLASRHFALVFGHGFEFQDAAAKVAREYPGTIFVTTSGSTVRSNVAPIVFELEQATYVLGFVAGSISLHAHVGMIGGVKVPSVASTFYAFAEGARSARARVKVSETYLGTWTDVSAAREATLAQIAAGSDVLIHNANEAAAGFFQAAQESDGVLVFGSNKNQNDLAPDRVLASATIDVPRALLIVAREVKDRQFWARSIRFGIRDGVIGIAWNPALSERVPAGVRHESDALIEKIRSGALQVPRGPF